MYPYFDETVNIPGDDPHTPYVYYDERISLSINVALAISRPLLVTGSPGSGKSTLAEDAAKRLGWTFLSATFTSHTRFEDLVAKTDSVSRLADAQLQRLGRDSDYLVPGILWWAFDGESAEQLVDSQPEAHRTHDPRVRSVHDAPGTRKGTVLLLDEIDKAEPDLPNDLLGPLGGDKLRLPGGRSIQAPLTNTLVILTSNGERALPPAFLRRCVHLDLRTPTAEVLHTIARSHYGPAHEHIYQGVAARWTTLAESRAGNSRRTPAVAEYLDTVLACIKLEEAPGGESWSELQAITLDKFAGRDGWNV